MQLLRFALLPCLFALIQAYEVSLDTDDVFFNKQILKQASVNKANCAIGEYSTDSCCVSSCSLSCSGTCEITATTCLCTTTSMGASTALLVVNWTLGFLLLVGMLFYYYNGDQKLPATDRVLDCCTITIVTVLFVLFGLLGLVCAFCYLASKKQGIELRQTLGR